MFRSVGPAFLITRIPRAIRTNAFPRSLARTFSAGISPSIAPIRSELIRWCKEEARKNQEHALRLQDGRLLEDSLTEESPHSLLLPVLLNRVISSPFPASIGHKIVDAALANYQSPSSAALLDIPEPRPDTTLTVCGDVHGQLQDVYTIFMENNMPSETNHYLFNGDFVDRGNYSCEIAFLFFFLKLLMPNSFHLLRGNHEDKRMNQHYGFEAEINHKYAADATSLFSKFQKTFEMMPLSAVLGNKVFVVHGGLPSRAGITINDIRNWRTPNDPIVELYRDDINFCLNASEQTAQLLRNDLLWNDPASEDDEKWASPKEKYLSHVVSNRKRGGGWMFRRSLTEQFLADNKLDFVIRSHEVRDNGFQWEHNNKLVTVFSASNYAGHYQNNGAYIRFKNGNSMKPECVKFNANNLGRSAMNSAVYI
eukprot:TRINITY_DN3610_c0_g1_i1.p1 TRINITY_DN3610_c0_g1~~TRINITY_DN3610_c0_g1_i1.p1  ORF type:complete len:424 (-),score=47.77 TRINITY_DN3610_c0_g1_i1:116-1387(-)